MKRGHAALGLIALCAAYLLGYGWARLTHRLVFNGENITGPHASQRPPGFTTWELVFLPIALTEATVRSTLGLTFRR